MLPELNMELSSLAFEAIVDLLAQKTQRFTQLLSENTAGDEFKNCKNSIEELIKEIKLRQSVTISETNIEFKKPVTT